jgi:hypothetical protein
MCFGKKQSVDRASAKAPGRLGSFGQKTREELLGRLRIRG